MDVKVGLKKAEHRRIDAFELWCWRRLLRVPWTARQSNQSILKEISPGCSLEGLMLKLKLQYFGHLLQRADSLEKTLMLGKIEGRRRRGHKFLVASILTFQTHLEQEPELSKTPMNTVLSSAGRNSATLWTFPAKHHLIYCSWSAHIHKNCWALDDAST